MNVAAYLSHAAATGIRHPYNCPCHAEGVLTELAPNVFVVNYEHELWCPVINDPTSN